MQAQHPTLGTQDCKVEKLKGSRVLPMSYDAKLREILRNLCSLEVKIYSDASKEFISILRSDSGGEFLHYYVQVSPSCTELMEAWNLRQGKAGMIHTVSLISVILDHPDGKYCMDDIGRLTISRKLDKVAQLIVNTKMPDVYSELNSREAKRQCAVLLLMAAIVRRGVGLASEVAKIFDFKLSVFPKLAEIEQKKGGKKLKHVTRPAFIEYALSFLEIGNPRLLRWILQQKDMYFSVLRGLGSDDEPTVIHVLRTLQDKVLNLDSLVPPSLRSVLFGSVTLEQLSGISGNPSGGPTAEMAHEILIKVCTDPCNGLMPDLKDHINPLRGNPKRLLELMKKLKATEVKYHRDLLLAVVSGRPSLCSAYMDEFPYALEPRATSLWFAAISLAADLISSSNIHLSFAPLGLQPDDPPPLDDFKIQCMLKCILPRSFTRLVINRGLLHSDILVKHGSLRLLLEALKSFDSVIGAINDVLEKMTVKRHALVIREGLPKYDGLLGTDDVGNVENCPNTDKAGDSCSSNFTVQKWMHFKREIQNEVRALLPDAQVILKLLSSLSCERRKHLIKNLKRARTPEYFSETHQRDGEKRLKLDSGKDDVDILIGGITVEHGASVAENYEQDKGTFVMDEGDPEKDSMTILYGIWDSHEFSVSGCELKDAEIYFNSKLLDVLTFYLRTMPIGLEGSFDIFKMLPSDPLILPVAQQQSLLSLLMEYIGQSSPNRVIVRSPELMYKHLQPMINLLIHSPVKDVHNQAYVIAQAAMLSTGAFDRNPSEVDVWFFFLPGYKRFKPAVESEGPEVFRDFSRVIIPFFCDAVSTMGNNLYKYLDNMRNLSSKLQGVEDVSLDFSPLVMCILSKCLRLLCSDSGTFKLSEKVMISTYVCNTLCFLLQTQVDGRALSGLIECILMEKFGESNLAKDDSDGFLCEWRPLKRLLHFAQSIIHQQAFYGLSSISERATNGGCQSLLEMLCDVKSMIGSVHDVGSVEVATAFLSALVCSSPDDALEHFPLLITVAQHVFRRNFSFLYHIFFLERNLLANVAKLWPDMFFSGLEMVGNAIRNNQNDDAHSLSHDMGDSDSSITEKLSCKDIDSMESVAAAFSSFLKQAPFHILLPLVTTCGSSELLDSSEIICLLKDKLSECSVYDSVSSLRLVLFWVYQVWSIYRAKPSSELGQMLHTCLILIEHILSPVLVMTSSCDSGNTGGLIFMPTVIQEFTEILLHHPLVTESLSRPFCNKETLSDNIGDILEDFLSSSKCSVHLVDYHILHLVKRVGDYLLSLGNAQSSLERVHDTVYQSVVDSFRQLVRWVVLLFKGNFELCMKNDDLIPLLPRFYALHALLQFISPFALLELVEWTFCKIEHNSIGSKFSRLCALTVGFYIAVGAFDTLSFFWHQKKTDIATFHFFWEIEGRTADGSLLERVYFKIVDFATCYKLECADVCLLKAVNAAYLQKSILPQQTTLLSLNMVLLRMVARSPLKILTHLIFRTCKLRAKTLFELTEVSPVHLSLFGQIFMRVLNKDSSLLDVENTANSVELKTMHRCTYSFSDEEFILLLPSALSYLTSNIVKFGKQCVESFRNIPLLYSKILLDGFLNWKRYVSKDIFQEEYNEFSPSSMEELHGLFSSSLLGKAICMLRYYFVLNENSLKSKKRLKIFDSLYTCSDANDELLDCEVTEINIHSLEELLNFMNRVVAKITFTRMLLFPQDNSFQSLLIETDESTIVKTSLEAKSSKIDCAKLRFVIMLVGALDKIVKRFLVSTENSNEQVNAVSRRFFRFLELYMLRNIVQISTRMQNYLIKLNTIPFLEPFVHSSFRHRFEDPNRLKALRLILSSVSEGKFSSHGVIELVLAHSQFVSTILWNDSHSSGLPQAGILLRPLSSLLKLIALPSDLSGTNTKSIPKDQNMSIQLEHRQFDAYKRKLELVRLLRVLYHLKACQDIAEPGKDLGMKSRELLSLLLSGYGATLSEIDLEIFHLMNEIESDKGSDPGSIADMDYLWGASALKIRREQTLDRFLLSGNMVDCETTEERRKRQFRENLPLDPKLCAMTALRLTCDRITCTERMSLMKLKQDSFMDFPEDPCCSAEKTRCYDPAFILPFSIHCLLMGYIDPMEFAGLGLLSISLVSLSSLDEGIRKLGYEALGSFKKALEDYRKSKDGLWLQLLLTYLQNGISEPWQKVPSVISIFAAEASLILLDPSHDHFSMVSKFLMRSPRVDLKCVPLFHTLFGSSSIHFKTDRLWILRVLYAGLNFDDDAQIFMRKYLLEFLMSFYVSSLSDYESKILILQMVKKAVKLHTIVRYLVEHCSLFSWLSSVLLYCGVKLHGDHREFYLKQMALGLAVVNDIISLRHVTEWLQEYALEELAELSSYLYTIFVDDLKLVKENPALADSILHILVSTLWISQKRQIYQPHFTFSMDDLFQLYQAIDDNYRKGSFSPTAELGLKFLLMNTPPTAIFVMNGGKLLQLIMWAVAMAQQASNTQTSQCKEVNLHSKSLSEEQEREDSLISKLLRWLIASVILRKISSKFSSGSVISQATPNADTLQSLLERIGMRDIKSEACDYSIAAIIMHLQRLLGMNCLVLPSVVSSLCLLLSDVIGSSDTRQECCGSQIASLCSKIRCPFEANPAWRWSYYHPWKDRSSELTDLQRIEEQHACQSLLLIFSNSIQGSSVEPSCLSCQDIEKSGLFASEKKIILRCNSEEP